MVFENGNFVLDKGEAQAIVDHIQNYGLSIVGLKISVDIDDTSIEFRGQQNLTLRFKDYTSVSSV